MKKGANGSQLHLFAVTTFLYTASVCATELSIMLLNMTIPCGVRWSLGVTETCGIAALRILNNMPEIFRWLKCIQQHSLSGVITVVTLDVFFL